MSGAERKGGVDRPVPERRAAAEAVVKKAGERGRKPQFPPGVLNTFRPIWAEVCSRAQIGVVDTEAVIEQSIEVPEKMTPRGAANRCKSRKYRVSAIDVVDALVDPTVLRPLAMGDLTKEDVKGLKALLWVEIARFFAPAKKKKRPVLK